jgi:pilus assembly protein Flp/PilA
MLQKLKNLCTEFASEEEGLALTEYLILLGLLTGGVIVAVLSIGGSLNIAWTGWADWFETNIEILSGPDDIAT